MPREHSNPSGDQELPESHTELVFAALADPMRRQILINLADNSPKTATELAREYPITQQGIYKHLRILEQAGLVVTRKKGRDVLYFLTIEPLNELDQWVKDLSAVWDGHLLRLKTMLENDEIEE